MRSLIVTFTLLAVSIIAMAQAPVLKWQKTLGGTDADYGYAIQSTADGGYLACGAVNSTDGTITGNHGSTDMWVVKLNDTGAVVWKKCIGGTAADAAFALQVTADGGSIVVGSSMSSDGDATSNNGNPDLWVVKLSSTGAIQWQRSLGGFMADQGKSVQQTFDGGYIIAGQTYSNEIDVSGHHGTGTNWDYWVVKLNSGGGLDWQKCLGGSGDDVATCIRQTKDTGFIVCGSSSSTDGDITGHHDSTDFWIVKLSSTGSIQWQKSLGGTSADQANSIIQAADGGYVAVGYTTSTDGNVTSLHGTFDCWVVKLSSTGTLQWQKTYGGTAYDEAFSIIQGTDGSYVISAGAASFNGDVTTPHGGEDYWIFKISPTDSLVWQKTFGGNGGDAPYCIRQCTDGNYIVAGITYSTTGDVTGKIGPGSTSDIWVVKISNPTLGIEATAVESGISMIPNPTSGTLSLTGIARANLAVYNTSGQMVKTAANSAAISIAELPSGLYFITVSDDNGMKLQQLKVIKNP